MYNKPRERIFYLLVIFLFVSSAISGKAYADEKINYSYIYSVSKKDYIKYVDQTNNSVDIISPNYYEFSKDGNVVITANFDSNFINEMHNRGVKVVPFLSNHWDKVAAKNALKNTETVTTKIVEEITKQNLDGINIDIEGLSDTERDSLSQFIKVLSEKMPMGKELSVAVAANPKGWKTGWHGSYDYKVLADHTDYLIIMAYDESSSGSKPGPVASLNFVEKSIQYAINQGVESDKIVLGVPFYGRIWRLEDLETMKGVVGSGIWMNRISSLIDNYGGVVNFDETKGSFVGNVTIEESDPPFKLFSWSKEPFKPGTYEVWFDNAESIQKKLELVNKYDLKGTANWSLGQESITLWDQYKVWLNSAVEGSNDSNNPANPAEDSNIQPNEQNQEPENNQTDNNTQDNSKNNGQRNPSTIEVLINGEILPFTDQTPIIKSGRTLVPLRGIFEALGATVQWDPNKKEITAISGNNTIWLKANSKMTKVNGETKNIEVAAQIINGRTMVPLRFVGESFGATVNWDEATKTIIINK